MLLLLACQSKPEPVSPEKNIPAYGRVEPVWTMTDLEAIFADDANFPVIGPQELRDSYFELMSHGDESCPGDATQLYGQDLRGCTSSSGYFYAGVSTWMEGNDGITGWMLTGDFEILDPAGHRFSVGGAVTLGQRDGNLSCALNGSWSWPGGSDGWLAEGISAYLSETVDNSGAAIQLDDGFSYRELSWWFDHFRMEPVRCGPGEFTGTVRLRDPSGGWYVLEYGSGCTPCPTVHFASQAPIDTGFCPDWTPWMTSLMDHLEEP